MTLEEMAAALKSVRGVQTQREVALTLGIAEMRISRWERKAARPSIAHWRLLHDRWPEVFPLDGRPVEAPVVPLPVVKRTRGPQRRRVAHG